MPANHLQFQIVEQIGMSYWQVDARNEFRRVGSKQSLKIVNLLEFRCPFFLDLRRFHRILFLRKKKLIHHIFFNSGKKKLPELLEK
jgi:hypothetical protein